MINRTYFTETFYDMPVEIAQRYANLIREAIIAGKPFEGEKKQGFFLSLKGGKTIRGNFEDKLYVGNIHSIENHLWWKDEELADDDQIINVVMIDGPVTRDGDGCSYGSKDHRNQILYANSIPQVVGHIFVINTPGGAASARIDYQQAIDDCRAKGKPTVAWVDGLCASAGQWVAALCDRTIVMNGKDTMGCIGTMCAFWGVPNGTVDRDGYRYIELVSVTSPDKNAEYREAVDGKTEKLQLELDKLGKEFRESVRQNRPQVKDEHLTGKTFEAGEVMGALVDEIGDYARAIQAVFDLADGSLKPAREVEQIVNDPDDNTQGNTEQEDMAQLTEQQKAAIAAKPDADLSIENGHVKQTVPTLFGPEEQEIATPKKETDMTDEEKKAQEAAAAPAAQEETVVPTAAENNANEDNPVGEESPTSEETPAEEEAPANEEAIAERDKEIASLKESLATLNGIAEERDAAIKERDDISASLEQAGIDYAEQGKKLAEAEAKIAEHVATIETLKKQVADLQDEVKELANNPAPMNNAQGGVPADNGTGEAPKPKKRITSGMSYEEIRAIEKETKK